MVGMDHNRHERRGQYAAAEQSRAEQGRAEQRIVLAETFPQQRTRTLTVSASNDLTTRNEADTGLKSVARTQALTSPPTNGHANSLTVYCGGETNKKREQREAVRGGTCYTLPP